MMMRRAVSESGNCGVLDRSCQFGMHNHLPSLSQVSATILVERPHFKAMSLIEQNKVPLNLILWVGVLLYELEQPQRW